MKNAFAYEVHIKERIYFGLKIVAAIIGYGFIFLVELFLLGSGKPQEFIVLIFYALIFLMYLFFRLGLLTGYIKGNAVKVTPSQFPEIHAILLTQCRKLEINNVPDLYIMQSGGILNAFATTFLGSNYIVLYSEIAEEAFQNNKETVEFVIGHELGHIKRKHMLKSLLLFPSFIIPFLNSAYSRACEYTCDNIGASLCPNGVKPGLILLASGKNMWNKVNVEKFIEQGSTENGFWVWLAEKTSSHPNLTKRVKRFNHFKTTERIVSIEKMKPENMERATDYSSYMPK